jgi:hypothetical protein
VLLDIAMESAKAHFKTDAEGTWRRMLVLAGQTLRPQDNGRQSLAQALAAATACASFCELALASKRPDGEAWLESFRQNLELSETLLKEASKRGELLSLSSERTNDLHAHIALLRKLSESYPKS